MSKEVLIKMYENYLISRQSDNILYKMQEFSIYMYGNKEQSVVSDELLDFLDLLMKRPARWQEFAHYIESVYPSRKYKKVLDIGCGITADLSVELTKRGYKVVAMDPKVRTIDKVVTINDYFNYKTSNVRKFDLLVGLEPCDATEHIIRSAMKNKKPFVISLCATAHDSIDGQQFENMDEWYDYLLSVSNNGATLERKKVKTKTFSIIKSKKR